MNIVGLQKMTLLDYPGKVACTVFLGGCNFRCPFCHNKDLLDGKAEPWITEEELLEFLKKRQGLLDAVCISGGEPTLQQELIGLAQRIKDMGYLVKLDTNGSNPALLKALVTADVLDYVAMDIKNCPRRYGETAGVPKMDLSRIEESIRFLMSDAVDYEFRTTVAEQLHSLQDMKEMGQWLQSLSSGTKPKRLFIQPYRDSEGVLCPGLCAPEREVLTAFCQELQPYVGNVSIRGID